MNIGPVREEGFGGHRALGRLVGLQSMATPRHVPFLERRFSAARDEQLRLCDEIAVDILRLAGDELDDFLRAYDFICTIQKKEEIHFRRHGVYRLSRLHQAVEEIYSNSDYMRSYMRGLLMTQVFWSNHTAAMAFFLEKFLAHNRQGYDLLEIGPGHGLLLSRSLADSRAASVSGWDISAASIAATEDALRKLGTTRDCKLQLRDIFAPGDKSETFDAVVFSEVLEHMEEPARALDAIAKVMRPGARLYVNVPVNSPAPDHLFLLRSPEDAVAFVRSQGFEIEQAEYFPATNYSLEAARKHSLSISTCIVAIKPGG